MDASSTLPPCTTKLHLYLESCNIFLLVYISDSLERFASNFDLETRQNHRILVVEWVDFYREQLGFKQCLVPKLVFYVKQAGEPSFAWSFL